MDINLEKYHINFNWQSVNFETGPWLFDYSKLVDWSLLFDRKEEWIANNCKLYKMEIHAFCLFVLFFVDITTRRAQSCDQFRGEIWIGPLPTVDERFVDRSNNSPDYQQNDKKDKIKKMVSRNCRIWLWSLVDKGNGGGMKTILIVGPRIWLFS